MKLFQTLIIAALAMILMMGLSRCAAAPTQLLEADSPPADSTPRPSAAATQPTLEQITPMATRPYLDPSGAVPPAVETASLLGDTSALTLPLTLKGTPRIWPGDGEAAQAAVSLAVAALQARLNLPADQIQLVDANQQEIPDLRFGCGAQPKKGEAPVHDRFRIQGWVIQLRASGQTYTFHSDGQKIALCP